MTEYRLENGDKIEEGKLYKTRDGNKVKVLSCLNEKVMVGIEGCEIGYICDDKGKYCNPNCDLISLWLNEPVTKCDQLGKIEVTDEIFDIAFKAFKEEGYHNGVKRSLSDYERLKTALQAVFTHIANQPEKPDSSIFCDCNLPGCWYCASEHKRRGLQDNDGWIEWLATDSLQPPVPATTRVQVKGSKGNRYENEARNFCWGTQTKEFIIAYRIISESKEEKPDINKLSDQIQSITDQVLEITSMIEAITKVKAECECKTASVVAVNNMQECIKCGEKVTQKEPKKQTLKDIMINSHPDVKDRVNMSIWSAMSCLSEYLENN